MTTKNTFARALSKSCARAPLMLSCAAFSLLAAAPAMAQTAELMGGIGFDELTTDGQVRIQLNGGAPASFVGSIGARYSDVDGDLLADGSNYATYTPRVTMYWDGTHGATSWAEGTGTTGVISTSLDYLAGEDILTSARDFDSVLVSNNSNPLAGTPVVAMDRALQLRLIGGSTVRRTAFSVDASGYGLTGVSFTAFRTGAPSVTIQLGLWDGTQVVSLGQSVSIAGQSASGAATYSFDLSGLNLEDDQFDLVFTYARGGITGVVLDNIQIIGYALDATGNLMIVWQGGDGTWGVSPANALWSNPAGTASGAWDGGFATFGGAAGTITVDTTGGPVNFSGAEFQTAGYVIDGGDLTIESGSAELRVGDGLAAEISAGITGTGGLRVTGAGALTLSGIGSYDGDTDVEAGTLILNGDYSAVLGDLNVAAGATFGGLGSYGGTATIADNATLLGRAGQTLTLGGLSLNPNSQLGATLGLTGADPTLALVRVNGDLVLDGVLNLSAGPSFGSGLYRLFDYTGALTDNGLDFGALPGGVLESDLSIDTSGAGQVGLLFAASSMDFWQGTESWNVNPAGQGWGRQDGSTTEAWDGDLAIFAAPAGVVNVDDSFGAVTFNDAQFAADGYVVSGDALTLTNAASNVRVGDGTSGGATYVATINSQLVGSGGLVKNDLGTLVLGGANSYDGATHVAAGTLLINGDSSGADGAVTVASGAHLGGSGVTGGDVSVVNGGTLLGQSGQAFTMADLTLNSGSIINAALGVPSSTTLFQVNGDLTLDGVLNVSNAGGFGVGLYRLFNYTGGLTDNGLSFGIVPTGTSASDFLLQTGVSGQINLLYADAGSVASWSGGGAWSASDDATNWTYTPPSATGAWRPGFALFQGAGQTVEIDDAAGAVAVTGVQFADDDWRIEGDALTITDAQTVFRVGDGTTASSGVSATIASNIVGAGGLVKDDFGTLILTGNNAYTGATILRNGALQISSNDNLGAGAVSFDGGTLRAGAGFSFTRALSLGAGGGAFDTNGFDVTFGGALSGAGDFAKIGEGVLTLSGANIFTGETRIIEGRVHLDNATTSLADTIIGQGAALSGLGRIRGDLTNHGVLSPGASAGEIRIDGNYTQSATGLLWIELGGIQTITRDRLTINGAADLAGTLAVTGIGTFTPEPGHSFTVINATGGVSGAFDDIVSDWDAFSAMLQFVATYNPTSVDITLTQLPFAGVAGASANQTGIGAGFDSALITERSDVPPLVADLRAALNSLPTEDLVLASLSELSPQRYERLFSQAAYSAGATARTIETRLNDAEEDGRAAWMEAVHRESRFDAAGDSTAAEGQADGFIIGGDGALSPDLRLGVSASFATETLDLDEVGSVAEGERFGGAVYARYDGLPVVLDAVLGVNFGQFDSQRTVAVPGYEQIAEARISTFDTFANLRASLPFTVGVTHITPYAGLHYLNWTAEAFAESGAEDASLSLSEQDGTSLASQIGARFGWNFEQSGLSIAPSFDLAWRHEFEDGVRRIDGRFQGGDVFAVDAHAPETDGFTAALGVDVSSGESWSGYARVSGEWDTSVSEALAAQVGVRLRF